MKKRFVCILILLMMLIASSVVAFADGTSSVTSSAIEVSKGPNLSTEKGIAAFSEANKDKFFSKESVSEKPFIVDFTIIRDYSINDPLRHILTGMILNEKDEEVDFDNPVILIMYIKKDSQFIPLVSISTKTGKDINIVEGTMLLYAKVKLAYIGKDTINNIRLIAFRQSDVNSLVLDETLQITDIDMTVRNYTPFERVRVDLNLLIEPKTTE